MAARAVMVLGATSGAGKSWLATALCRWYARQGLRRRAVQGAEHEQQRARRARTRRRPGRDRQRAVFPGARGPCSPRRAHEPGAAQAGARHAQPGRRHGPGARRSRRGAVAHRGASSSGRTRALLCRSLLDENELVVIEGAGSPAEINLHASDYVNMRTAREAGAACLAGGRHRPRRRLRAPLRHPPAPAARGARAGPGLRAQPVPRRRKLAAARPRRARTLDRRAHDGGVADVARARPARGGRLVR